MTTRRSFLSTLAAGSAVAAFASRAHASSKPPLGIQLYSLREQLKKDVPGTLKMVRDWGLSEVETAGYYGRTAAAFAEELKRANLTAKSMHAGYELLRDNLKQAVSDAKALGATYVTTAWIPHKAPFKQDDIERAAAHFTEWGRALKNDGLGFMYHLHGYEFAPGNEINGSVKLTPAHQPTSVHAAYRYVSDA